MLTLAIDSTAKIASCAVLRDGRALASSNIDNGLTQSELLLPMVTDMLKRLKISFDDIELVAVSVGPGSFTGVRIGVSLVKGLAFGTDITISPVSTLEALAYNLFGLDGIYVAVMDARRDQVYSAVFEKDGERLKRLTEDDAISLDELYEILKDYSQKPIYLVGDGYDKSYRALCERGLSLMDTPALLRLESAVSVGRVGEIMRDEGRVTNDKILSPTYLRLPQAERERNERLKEHKKK
jgi:tRNA threonylcarbamoyladenosine biosynthesis protein TsaB